MESFRRTEPSAFLEMRIATALRERPAARTREQPTHARWRRVLGSLSILAACATVALVVVFQPWLDASHVGPFELAVTLPDSEHGTVELPWSLHAHERGESMVHLDAPAEIEHHEFEPRPHESTCEGARCVHRWDSTVHPADKPLLVKLDSPGRYEFHVLHKSKQGQSRSKFVVVAQR